MSKNIEKCNFKCKQTFPDVAGLKVTNLMCNLQLDCQCDGEENCILYQTYKRLVDMV